METYNEFEQPTGPEKSAGAIISYAFEVYKGVFLYAIAAILIMTAVSFFIQPVSGFNMNDLTDEYSSSPETFSENMWSIPGIKAYYGLSGLVSILLAPLMVGVIYISNKYNLKEPVSISDLLIGFKQNFLNILIYTIIASVIMGVAGAMCFFPLIFVLPLLLLGYPILLFENASFSEALRKSFKIGKENYGTLLGASFLGLLVSISGVFLCFVGIVFTLYFYLVVMYSAYCAYCGRPRPILVNK